MARILCDMDETVADCLGPWLTKLYLKHKNPLMLTPPKGWLGPEVAEMWGITYGEFIEPLNSPGFFKSLPLLDTNRVIEKLYRLGHEIIFVTKLPSNAPTAAYDKEIWIRENLPLLPSENLVFCHRKDILKGDVLIDDYPLFLNSFSGIKVLFDRRHSYFSGKTTFDLHVRSWEELLPLLIELLNQRGIK